MTLDEAIINIQQSDAQLSAEARNALHGATTGHPWCRGKTEKQRALEAWFAIAGRRGVPAWPKLTIERLANK